MRRFVLLCLLLSCIPPSTAETDIATSDSALMRGDYMRAVQILEALSKAGNAPAMVHLARLYYRGEGVPLDRERAISLYLTAAGLGNADAQFQLGNMYALGEGLNQSNEWALTFYALAAEQGHQLAAQNLRELKRVNGAASTKPPREVSQMEADLKAKIRAAAAASEGPPGSGPSGAGHLSPATNGVSDRSAPATVAADEFDETSPEKAESKAVAAAGTSRGAPIVEHGLHDSAAKLPLNPTPMPATNLAPAAATEVEESASPGPAGAQSPVPPVQPSAGGAQGDVAGEKPNPRADEASTAVTDASTAVPGIPESEGAPTAAASTSMVPPLSEHEPVEASGGTPVLRLTEDEVDAVRLAQSHGINVELTGTRLITTERAVTPSTSAAPEKTIPATTAGQESALAGARRALASGETAKAREQLTVLADAGNGDAALLLAELAEPDDGGQGDPDAAMHWRERAAALGNAEAQYQLGDRYLNGRGVVPDDAMAITYFRSAARAGHPQAQEKLRSIYLDSGLSMPEFEQSGAPLPQPIPKPAETNSTIGAPADTRAGPREGRPEPLTSAALKSRGADAIAHLSPRAYDPSGTASSGDFVATSSRYRMPTAQGHPAARSDICRVFKPSDESDDGSNPVAARRCVSVGGGTMRVEFFSGPVRQSSAC